MSRPGDRRPVVFDHLVALTDGIGLFEHAEYTRPRRDHGYCVDDAARAVVVTSRELAGPAAPDPRLPGLHEHYLSFVVEAVAADGCCHNRRDVTGRWTDQAGLGDWWGRALWGLGVAAASSPRPEQRTAARAAFRQAATRRSPDLRATAFAALGAAALAAVDPTETSATALLVDLVRRLSDRQDHQGRHPVTAAWHWPEERLSYANAALPEALLAAGDVLGDPAAIATGRDLLDFLLDIETRSDPVTGRRWLSVTPVAGRGPGDRAPGFDQQPVEVAAIADACATAHRVTGDTDWLTGVHLADDWFHGGNDTGVSMVDPVTGGGYDGLTATGRNANQGAESTLAAVSTAQQARLLTGDPPFPAAAPLRAGR